MKCIHVIGFLIRLDVYTLIDSEYFFAVQNVSNQHTCTSFVSQSSSRTAIMFLFSKVKNELDSDCTFLLNMKLQSGDG